MAAGDDRALSLFLDIYGTLPRAGPGGTEHTLRALGLVPGTTPRAVLDLGCGPGAQTVALASALPEAHIVAIDVLPSMVERASRRFVESGIDDRVTAMAADMADPPIAPGSQDLIWCEGAIYNVGVTEALRRWRPVLGPGGCVAFTEPVWLVDAPPQEIRNWWRSEYPPITDVAGVRSRVDLAGYGTIASFDLPPSAWWDEYYEPMQTRIAELHSRLPDDVIAGEIVAAARTEIDHFRRYADCYSYAFFVVQPRNRAVMPNQTS